MRLGLLTACLPGSSLGEIARWAGANGYAALELAAWPKRADRPYQASHLDVATLSETTAAETRDELAENGLEISAVAYYENNLHEDLGVRTEIHEHLHRCIDAAALVGCGLVGTFVGRDVSRPTTDNLRLAEDVFPPLVEYAAERAVRLVVENCPMEGWHPDGYPANLAYSPELWDWMAGLGLWLNFDPSHLGWLGIDPRAALLAGANRILHVQAKDVEIDPQARDRYGVFGQVIDREPWTSGWWRYRIPGLGQVDWRELVELLQRIGYDGVVSVEHEDPVWSGDPDKVREGFRLAQRTLGPLLAAGDRSQEA